MWVLINDVLRYWAGVHGDNSWDPWDSFPFCFSSVGAKDVISCHYVPFGNSVVPEVSDCCVRYRLACGVYE